MGSFERYRSPSDRPRGKPDFLREEKKLESRRSTPKGNSHADEWYEQMLRSGLVQTPESQALSRRKFLLGAGAVAAATALGTADYVSKYSSLAKWLDDKIVGQYDYDEAVKNMKTYMKDRYGIDLEMGAGKNQDGISGDPVALDKYKSTLRFIVQEMSKYPPEMIRKASEERGFILHIVDKPYIKDSSAGSRSGQEKLYVGGFAPFLKKGEPAKLILNANESENYLRSALHHELNHRFAEKWQKHDDRRQKWIGFHAAVSLSPYRAAQKGRLARDVPPERYFLTEHSAANYLEDQAVCAEWMMMPNLMVGFLDRWRNEQDPKVKEILAAKYIETKNNYAEWSDGKIGEAFWQAIIDESEKQRQEKAGS